METPSKITGGVSKFIVIAALSFLGLAVCIVGMIASSSRSTDTFIKLVSPKFTFNATISFDSLTKDECLEKANAILALTKGPGDATIKYEETKPYSSSLTSSHFYIDTDGSITCK